MPISEEQFRDRFYDCHDCRPGTWHFSGLCLSRTQHCKDNDLLLAKVPKRDSDMNEAEPGEEPYWGLLAVEDISFMRVMVYHLLALLGPVVFWGIWQSRNPDDIQDSSAPLVVALTSAALVMSAWTVKLASAQRMMPH